MVNSDFKCINLVEVNAVLHVSIDNSKSNPIIHFVNKTRPLAYNNADLSFYCKIISCLCAI